MKYLTISILLFIITSCFAINQKLIDGAEKYDNAIANLKDIEIDIRIARKSSEYWNAILSKDKNQYPSNGIIKLDQGHIDEKNKLIGDLVIQYNETKEIIKKYEPIKKEYDRQEEKELEWEKFKTAVLNITGMLILPLSAFSFILWFIIKHRKKYMQLLKEGKITQEEYDRLTRCEHTFRTNGINPATGLPLTGMGISDAGGNIRGSSHYNNSSSDSYSSSSSSYNSYDYLRERRDHNSNY